MNTVEALRESLFMDLDVLYKEIEAYTDEKLIWEVLPGTTNSAGVLFVHLTRSLRHFVGSSFANTGYLRQRDEEFTVRNLSKAEMISEFEILTSELNKAYKNIDSNKLDEDFPQAWRGGKHFPTHFMLTRMISHVNYHMGQINYHRRYFETNR